MVLLLEAKYIRGADFLEVQVSDSASFVWKSICAGRGVVRKGCVKQVVRRDSINVWRDPWIPD